MYYVERVPKPRAPWSLRLSDEDVRLIERAAKASHLAPRSWARAALLTEAERVCRVTVPGDGSIVPGSRPSRRKSTKKASSK